MTLNVHFGIVERGAWVYAPGLRSATALGFATIGDVLRETERELSLHGYTPARSPHRAYQGLLKDVLDRANNNLNFVQSEACDFSFEPWGCEDWPW